LYPGFLDTADTYDIQDRLVFAEIDAHTGDTLQACVTVPWPELPAILAEFYPHIRKFPELEPMFKCDAANIVGVRQAAADTARVAERVQHTSKHLQSQADDLERDVHAFLIELKTAA
jgi:hypothetical protein